MVSSYFFTIKGILAEALHYRILLFPYSKVIILSGPNNMLFFRQLLL